MEEALQNRPALRADILPTDNQSLSKEVLAVARKQVAKPQPARKRADEKRFLIRRELVESRAADPNGYERILGESDLTSINFLDRGRRAAAAVCRVKLPVEGGGANYGTGFLVGARLLMTNNHVLASREEASQAEAEFDHEHDLDGILKESVQFNLNPDDIFYTNVDLDVTFVAVVPFADNGTPLERYGRLPLLPVSGKAVPGEWVSIIQHPGSQPKQIAIRSSEILQLDPKKVPGVNLETFIHYSTDTEPGSSGAPVFNDQWQVVAIHHKAVPAVPGSLRRAKDEPRWIGNEGVRISAIYRHLNRNRFENENADAVLTRLTSALGLLPTQFISGAEFPDTEQYAPFKPARWSSPKLGYDPDFLTETISLDDICKKARKKKFTVRLTGKTGDELKYQHFSVIMHRRKFALLTAVNIDGSKLRKVPRKDTWRQDARISDEFQPDDEFYVKGKQKEKVYFSRGHLVRLLDPSWGKNDAEAKRGQEDTFHFTNAAPQVQGYNDTDWGNLEDYILDKAQGTEKKLTVFTGPVYLPDDPFYGRKRKGGPWQIPLSFWKVAVLQKTDNTIAAAAFIVGQTEFVRAFYEAKVFTGLRPYTIEEMRSRKIQITLASLEETIREQSPLDFSKLKQWDALGSLESTRQARWLRSGEDVQI